MKKFCFIVSLLFFFPSCEQLPVSNLEEVPFIPLVKKMVAHGGHFKIQANTSIVLKQEEPALLPVIESLQSVRKNQTGYTLVKKAGKQQLELSLRESLQCEA